MKSLLHFAIFIISLRRTLLSAHSRGLQLKHDSSFWRARCRSLPSVAVMVEEENRPSTLSYHTWRASPIVISSPTVPKFSSSLPRRHTRRPQENGTLAEHSEISYITAMPQYYNHRVFVSSRFSDGYYRDYDTPK